MKFAVIALVVVLVLLWMTRKSRATASKPHTTKTSTRDDMVACIECGVHVPRSEALPGRGGLFCGEEHRARHERIHSRP